MEFKGWVLHDQKIEADMEFIPLDAVCYLGYVPIRNNRRVPAILFSFLLTAGGFGTMFYGPGANAREAGAILLMLAFGSLIFAFGKSRAFILACTSGQTLMIRESVGDDDLRTFEIFVELVLKKRDAYIRALNQNEADPIDVS